MEIDKKTIIAVLLIGLIFFLMNTEFYQKHFLPQPAPQTVGRQGKEPQESGYAQDKELGQKTETGSPEADTQTSLLGAQTAVNLSLDSLLAEGEDITVETDLYQAVFSSRGATLKSWRLKKYQGLDSASVQLFDLGAQDSTGNLGLVLPGLGLPSPGDKTTDDTGLSVFKFDKREIVLNKEGEVKSLEFVLDLGGGRQIKKVYTFYQGYYSFDLKVEISNLHRALDGISYYLTWRTGMKSTEQDFEKDMQRAKGYAYQGEVDDFDMKDEAKSELFDTSTDWVGIRTKYFASVVIPKSSKGESVRFGGTPVNVQQEVPLKKYSYDLEMPFVPQRKKVDHFVVYLGPLDYDILKSYNVGLEDMMDLGWAIFRPFGKFVLWSFTLLHTVIPNYGFVIILFSILIKVVLFPLTRKSYQSMKQMQALKPLMDDLNEKYKDDPQKKQQAVMEMYREYGVNPLGGCIPMVLQMPLLYAMFNVFRSTIELRGAGFIWWITDLSRPDSVATLPFTIPLYGDTVNILPLFMGITMFIQQKMTITDQKQKALVYFMPIFLTLLFNSFPSGLNLYYALFNLLSIMQEKLIPYKIKTLEELKQGKKQTKVKKRRVKYDYRGRMR
ncbi:MAG: membrane protein insertase YidC [bacterium]